MEEDEQMGDKSRKLLEDANLDALLVTNKENRFYLSGFTGSDGVLLLTADQVMLFIDSRYTEQAGIECPNVTLKCLQGSIYDDIGSIIENDKINTIGFEAEDLSYSKYIKLKDNLTGAKLVPTNGLVENLRVVKNDKEIANIRHAAHIADETFEHILKLIKPGVRESSIALEMEYFMRKAGAEGIAFDFIVASGVRSALPHGKASDKKIEKGDLLTIDFGAVYGRYHSDMTRTLVIGYPTTKQQRIYDLVLEAQIAGIEKVKAGVRASEVDKSARDIIDGQGYGEYFRHGTGHGVGLAVHEEPRISAKNDFILRAGMVITVEPGVYIPGWGGVRIEDMVIVKEAGYELITKSPKEKLIQI